MTTALIGHTGFVGSTLHRQTQFDAVFRSATIDQMRDRYFDRVVCAGAPGQKWLANNDPEADRQNIEQLIRVLESISCKHFVLISTVDVFQDSSGADERTRVEEEDLLPYGLHRRRLERFIENTYASHLIVRLPGLVGPGLRKNVIFDLLNNNKLESIDSRSRFQFYPTANLWHDIQIAISNELSLIHLTAEPVDVSQVAEQGFGMRFDNALNKPVARYDMQSGHARLFGGAGRYQYSARETLQAVRTYAQSEPRKITDGKGDER
jgi:hypothetical protein